MRWDSAAKLLGEYILRSAPLCLSFFSTMRWHTRIWF